MSADAFARLAIALRALASASDESVMPDVLAPGSALSVRVRNQLLDACGSDHRPLVDFVLAVAPDVRLSLHAMMADTSTTVTQASWERFRAPLVHRLVATRFLQQDMARWAVDLWGYALRIYDIVPAPPSLAAITNDTRVMAGARASSSAQHKPSVAPIAPRGAGRRAMGFLTSPSAPIAGLSSAVMAPNAAQHASWSARRTAARRSARGTISAVEIARVLRVERLWFTVITGALVLWICVEAFRLVTRPVDRAPRNTAAVVIAPAPAVADAFAPSNTRARVGVLEQRSATMELTRGWLGPVAGMYRVSHATRSVVGGDGCDRVTEALALQQTSIEAVEHDESSDVIRWPDRAIDGHVDAGGRFETGPDSGLTNGVRWTFAMSGRFTRTGFFAEAVKTTSATLGWHRERSCAIIADLTGTRLAARP